MITNNKGLGLRKKVKVTEKEQEASYLVAEIIAKIMKPHSIAKSLILSSCCATVKTLFDGEAEKK